MNERFPICVWGAGPAGANFIRDLAKCWELEVVGFINRSPERRDLIAKQTQISGFASFEELLAAPIRRPRAVVIATANPTHADFACQAMEAGLDVFCEKPMGQNAAEAKRMMGVQKKTGRKLQLGFEYRFGTVTGRIKELCLEGVLGNLTSIDITDSRGHWWPESPTTDPKDVWRLNREIGGGPLLHCGIHQLDLMRYYGGDIVAVQAFVPPTSLSFYPAGIPDHLELQFRFRNGAAGTFRLYHLIAPTWYRSVPPHNPNYHQVPGHDMDVIITGRAGSLIAKIYKEEIHLNRFDVANRETVFVRTERFDHQHPNASHHNSTGMVLDFCRRCRDGQEVITPAEDAYQTSLLGWACEEAVQKAITDGWTSGPIRL